jgi:hypothetical protein
MSKRRKLRLLTDDDETLVFQHSEKDGSLNVLIDDDWGDEARLKLSPRQSSVLINWILRLKGKLDQAQIPPAE